MDEKGEASRKLVEKVIDALLNAEVEEQISNTFITHTYNRKSLLSSIV
ncbi:hypothetical protein HMPREF3191_00513 [Veillonellaceae bacterium DNF00626]|nr:hypothetical protein HMPREF3191_00513 [Veillonellaceae bacterium DNF00626]